MTWVRLDDGFPDHPKVDAAGPLAAWLYVCGLAYCARFLTDGHIPADRVARLAAVAEPLALAARLVEVGLWERTTGGYRVHDYLEFQPSAERVRRERTQNAHRQEDFRARRNGASNGVTPPVTHAERDA
jgi:hypothetical protein